MGKIRSKRRITPAPNSWQAEDFSKLSRSLLDYANRGVARIEFLREVSNRLMEFSDCDAVELWLRDPDLHYRWHAVRRPKRSFSFVILPDAQTESGTIIPTSPESASPASPGLEQLCRDVVRGRFDPSLPFFTRNGSFWTGDTRKPLRFRSRRTATVSRSGIHSRGCAETLVLGGPYRSLALIRFVVDNKTVGLLQLKSPRRNHFTQGEVELYEGVAQTLGLAVANRRVQWALRERLKELTCLYGIARVAQRPEISLGETLQAIVGFLPPAWQYPEIACSRIVLDGRAYTTSDFQEGLLRQAADIVVSETRRGVVEVVYTRHRPEFAEGPFLKEERSLIDAVAREVVGIIERREAEDDKLRLQDQLRQADRLATIGQLVAGVAHELNEPLGNILGFAQLAKKDPKLPERSVEDMEKIVKACLYAREVIHKLLLFARQSPPQKNQVNLNQTIEEGLYFLESRCAKAGIELVRELAPHLPEVSADPLQLQQILVNLVVNAVQAMPDGGKLTIKTLGSRDHVWLIIKDTGIGMTEEVKNKLFTPFFTTKDGDQGTGLGLAVVHGIVASHGGSIRVESEVGKGARFEIQLPVRAPAEGKKSD
jgi:two-component system NtrC family sensor kinase